VYSESIFTHIYFDLENMSDSDCDVDEKKSKKLVPMTEEDWKLLKNQIYNLETTYRAKDRNITNKMFDDFWTMMKDFCSIYEGKNIQDKMYQEFGSDSDITFSNYTIGTCLHRNYFNHILNGEKSEKCNSCRSKDCGHVKRAKQNKVRTDEYAVAMKLLKNSAKKGNPWAQYELAQLYRNYYETGLKKKYNHSGYQYKYIKWLKKSAKSGCHQAQLNLAECYWHGQSHLQKDKDSAFYWYLEARGNLMTCKKEEDEIGNKEALWHIGYIYHDDKKYDLAYKYYLKSATGKNPYKRAYNSICRMYYFGEINQNDLNEIPDYRTAYYWHKKIEDNGDFQIPGFISDFFDIEINMKTHLQITNRYYNEYAKLAINYHLIPVLRDLVMKYFAIEIKNHKKKSSEKLSDSDIEYEREESDYD